jgi:hypothetical protein
MVMSLRICPVDACFSVSFNTQVVSLSELDQYSLRMNCEGPV